MPWLAGLIFLFGGVFACCYFSDCCEESENPDNDPTAPSQANSSENMPML